MVATPSDPMNHRSAAILRAVAAGRVEIAVGCQPVLRIDGRPCSDQMLACELVHAGLVRAGTEGPAGSWLPAVVADPAGAGPVELRLAG